MSPHRHLHWPDLSWPGRSGPLMLCLALIGTCQLAQAQQAWVEKVLYSGQAPHQINFSPDAQTTYVAASGSDRIDVYATQAGRWQSAFPASGVPLGVAVNPQGELLVSRFFAAELEILDAHGQALGELPIGAAPSLLIPVPGTRPRWLVSSEKAHQVSLVTYQADLGQAEPAWQLSWAANTGQRPFPASSDGKLVFVPNYNDGTVSVLDLEQGKLLKTIVVGERPSGGSILPGGKLYAVAVRGENHLALIDTETLEKTAEIREGIGESPFSVVVDEARGHAYVNNTASHDISIIDLSSQRVIQRLAVGELPIVMALQPDGQRLWVSCEGSHNMYLVNLNAPQDAAMNHETTPLDELRESARQEIRQLHFFFQEWFNGRLPQDEASFARFTQVMAEDFSFIAPSANSIDRAGLVQALWQGHGRDLAEGGSRVWTENEQLRPLDPSGQGLWLGVYDEHQLQNGKHSIRRSSVILSPDTAAPLGWVWRHVHETWLQQSASHPAAPATGS